MLISGIVLTMNEEEMIGDCISSLSFCDEVIVVDSNSTDRTREIAQFLKAKVTYCDEESFAERRNFGAKKAKGTWILYVDADERISDTLAKNIKEVISAKDTKYAAYRLERKNFYFGNHEWPTTEKLERLFRKRSLKEWYGEIHESASVDGEIGDIDGSLLHYTHRDLSSMVAKTIKWSKVEAELRLKANHPQVVWWRFPRVMLSAFINSYVRQKGWRAGTVGIIESMYQSFSMFVTYARLWELQEQKKKSH